ncbi:O-methyltransferase [Bombiscardovia apis]|uniref:O-methyltransferase n=1 Tax=Bombiscardovia apis TaxID=2932182 RepID=A0ABM8BBX2_9BIFI|nr:methyltransferase [Bombiscardovia apis]BDR54418.1 O-methyltransferase [Bombiscardovia apis]
MNKTSYANHAQAWEYAEESALNAESDFLRAQRLRTQAAGFKPGSVTQGAFLKQVARASQAHSIIVLGTGSVVETVRLIEGLDPGSQFTAVDSSAKGADLIRQTFRELNPQNGLRLRAVNARAKAYFPRLNPQDYDLIVVAGEDVNYRDAIEEAPRLLKPRGQMILTDALCSSEDEEAGGVMNPANRSDRALLLRQLAQDCEQNEDFDSCLLPVGTGLLLMAKR